MEMDDTKKLLVDIKVELAKLNNCYVIRSGRPELFFCSDIIARINSHLSYVKGFVALGEDRYEFGELRRRQALRAIGCSGGECGLKNHEAVGIEPGEIQAEAGVVVSGEAMHLD